MTDDEARVLALAMVAPIRELLDKLVTLVEQVTARVEVLELEALHQKCTPIAPPRRKRARRVVKGDAVKR